MSFIDTHLMLEPCMGTQKTANSFGIEVEAAYKRELIRRLSSLTPTHAVVEHGEHRSNRCYSVIELVTAWSQEDLYRWLRSTKNLCYVSTWSRGRVYI